ncbi:MAG TPA: hypothetical protein VF182_16710 [Candidatus Binatia bacterium]|jgi:hypothetical protein
MDEQNELQHVVLTRLLRLNSTIQGIISGLVAGLGIFIATNWLVLKGGDVVGPHLSLLGEFFIGYEVSFAGSLIGFAYGFVTGFVVGYGVTTMYNYIVEYKERTSERHTKS